MAKNMWIKNKQFLLKRSKVDKKNMEMTRSRSKISKEMTSKCRFSTHHRMLTSHEKTEGKLSKHLQNLNQQVVEEQEEEHDYDQSPREDGDEGGALYEQTSPPEFNEAEED